jgi:ABC-type thiamine transport system ATPase subunit
MKLEQIEDYNGLKLNSSVEIKDNIAIVVGRNGTGKSRLLMALVAGKISAVRHDGPIAVDRIRNFADRLQPALTFGFDPVQHRDSEAQVKQLYRQFRGEFHADPHQSMASMGQHFGTSMGRRNINVHALTHSVSTASRIIGKNVNELDEQDVADFYSSSTITQLGSLNVTATMREYLTRQEKNDINGYRNGRHGSSLPYWSDEEFTARFGPPPWNVFNDILQLVLDGRYHIQPPELKDADTYEAKLRREDGHEIDPNFLSSGEKTLLWLSLSMYGASSSMYESSPKLLLLDEPDATLHPQMIQKLHLALNMLSERFGCNIIVTSHSPTTVALSDQENIFQISESGLISVEKDAAVAELLDGVDQVSIHYTNRRQVYVESFKDAHVYTFLFQLLKRLGKLPSAHISLSFIAAAPKLSPHLIQQLHKSIFGASDPEKVREFIESLNGQGNCAQVIGAVESLTSEDNQTVHGIIDWDRSNRPDEKVHVHAQESFYSIENAILNPLTLGIYLLNCFPSNVNCADLGLTRDTDLITLQCDHQHWQVIADAVTTRILGGQETPAHEVECQFLSGAKVFFDRGYVHKNGHELETLIRQTYPFLNRLRGKDSLLKDVLARGIQVNHGRTLPVSFVELFGKIQLGR